MASSWWKILPTRIGCCSNTNCARRLRCEDNNVAVTNVQPHYYRVRQVEPYHHLGWSSQALFLSLLALGAMPKQQQQPIPLHNNWRFYYSGEHKRKQSVWKAISNQVVFITFKSGFPIFSNFLFLFSRRFVSYWVGKPYSLTYTIAHCLHICKSWGYQCSRYKTNTYFENFLSEYRVMRAVNALTTECNNRMNF